MGQFTQSKVAAFGDSVMWGQGIKHKNKFTTLIAKSVFGLDFSPYDNYAQSGAKVTISDNSKDHVNTTELPDYGEISSSSPSITRQVNAYGLNIPKNTPIDSSSLELTFPDMEVVFLNGGINDIGAFDLVTGKKAGLSRIARLVRTHCELGLTRLLQDARRKFPNAQLISFGYHFVLSVDSLKSIIDVIELVAREDQNFARQYRNGVRTCHYFMSLSTAAYQKAIDEFNLSDLKAGNKGAFFVPSLHTENRASFASKSLVWDIKHLNRRPLAKFLIALMKWDVISLLEVIDLKDEVVDERRAASNIIYAKNLQNRAKCYMASLFHPNSSSARSVAGIARATFRDFAGSISVQENFSERSLKRSFEKLGFTSDVSIRQVFATNTVASIELRGTIKAGSSGPFPYYLLNIQLKTKSNSWTMKLNHLLPFIKGFSDGKDDVFPTPTGKITRRGGLSSEGRTERDARFHFFAYPGRIIPLSKVREISLISDKIKDLSSTDKFNMATKGLQLIINGRPIPIISRSINVLASGSKSEESPLAFL